MFADVLGAEPVQNEVRLVGHPQHVVPGRVGHQSSLVDEFDEGESGVLLQRCLPFLWAQEHHQLNDRRVAVPERFENWKYYL